jgi:preprotein translocase subunit SecA
VRDEKVQIVDEFTGRILATARGSRLHQMVEAKEGLKLSSQQTSVARITYSAFSGAYLLAGMTGTAKKWLESCGTSIACRSCAYRQRPVRQLRAGQVHATEDDKWHAIVERVRELHADATPHSSARARWWPRSG